MKLQDYNEGEIRKTRDGQYEYVVKGEVRGTYPSVAYLVNAYPEVGENNAKGQTAGQKTTEKKETAKRSKS